MNYINLFSKKDLQHTTRKRANEKKIGEDVLVFNSILTIEDELKQSSSKFVLVGIPEDIGVRANLGRAGASSAWKPVLDSFLNQQSNQFLNGSQIAVLGNVIVDDLMEKANLLNPKKNTELNELRKLVEELDAKVINVVSLIFKAKKIPLVIGGGHNNSYPLIKACSLIFEKRINVINCDPHTDFRALEGRHSGNGFSYAYNENYLQKYSVFALHEQYNNHEVLAEFMNNKHALHFESYENIFIKDEISFNKALTQCINFIKDETTGVEIDIDSITNAPSSAKTSSGLSPVQARQYVYQCGKQLNAAYLHIAEAAPILSHIKADNKTGKLLAYLITDFIKGVNDKNKLD